MKSFVAATLFALVRADCDSDAACVALDTCSLDLGQGGPANIGATHCDVPNVRQACCDIFTIGLGCQSEGQSCVRNALMALPPQELQWMQANGRDMNSMCPSLAAMQHNPQEFCSMGATPSDLLPVQFAIMTAQQYKPEKSGPVVPGVIGFAMGAAVATSVVAMNKKRNSAGLYTPLPKVLIICCLSCVALLVLYGTAAGTTPDIAGGLRFTPLYGMARPFGDPEIHVTALRHSWRLEVHTQVYVVDSRGGWQNELPRDAYDQMCSLRFHDETRVVINTVCHDESTIRTSQSNCHTVNGHRTCQTVSTPVMQRICNPVYQYYRNYDTWCEYTVNRWRPQIPAVSEGVGLAPSWPDAPVTNCGMLGCTRVDRTEQRFMVDFHIDDGTSAGSTDTCEWSAPGMWAWVNDNGQYQSQAIFNGAHIECQTLQTPQAAPPPADYQFAPSGGNYSDAPPQPPAHMTTAPPGPQYAQGGEFTGTVPPPAPSPPPPGAPDR